MANCLTFYHDKIRQLECIQQLMSGCPLNRFSQGSLNLVERQLLCDHKRLLELQIAFSRWVSAENNVLSADPICSVPLLPSSPSICSLSIPSLSTQPPSLREFPTMPEMSPHNFSSSSATSVSSLSTTLSVQPLSKRLFDFISPNASSPFVPRQFLSGTRNEQKKGPTSHSVSMPTNTPHLSESDTTSDNLSESSSTPFQDQPTHCPASIRVPESEVQSPLECSDDEESSKEEELPKQYWRAEKFHMEEFLKELRPKEPLTLDMLLPESDRRIFITTTKEPVTAVMHPTSFLKKKTVSQSRALN